MSTQFWIYFKCVVTKKRHGHNFQNLVSQPSTFDPIVLYIIGKLRIWRVWNFGGKSIVYILWSARIFVTHPDRFATLSRILVLGTSSVFCHHWRCWFQWSLRQWQSWWWWKSGNGHLDVWNSKTFEQTSNCLWGNLQCLCFPGWRHL